MCTHNGEAFVKQQLQSLSSQTWAPGALFIHDWNSIDGTREILQKFKASQTFDWPVFIFHHDAAPGARMSFVAGIKDCVDSSIQFDYLALCDQDDLWDSDKLERYATAIQTQKNPALVFGDARLIDEHGALITPTFYSASSPFQEPIHGLDEGLLVTNPVIGMTSCVSRSFLRTAAPFLNGPWMMHDWALALLAMAKGEDILYIPSASVSYRQHQKNVLGAAQGSRWLKRLRKASNHFDAIRRQALWLSELKSTLANGDPRTTPFFQPINRFAAARTAFNTRLLKPSSRWLLAGATLLFWRA